MALRPLRPYRLERFAQPTEQEGRSRFGVAFPIAALPSVPGAPSVGALTGKAPLIMVIDDSQTIRKIVEVTLRRAGYEVVSFPDGVEVLRWLRERKGPVPRLTLLDIQLPKVDGYDMARTLRGKTALEDMTIIMMSSRDGVVDRLKGRLAGARAYLTKPFTSKTLLQTVHQYLENKAQE